MPSARRVLGLFGALWGCCGVMLLLGKAVLRMAPFALDIFSIPLGRRHWAALFCAVAGLGYVKGYLLFQRNFSPRVAARARHLRDHPRLSHLLLAPLFCMGFFHAPRRRVVASFSVTAAIVLLVVVMHGVPQPWRGIVYCGVVSGLGWGIVTLALFSVEALAFDRTRRPPELPAG